MNKKQFEKLMKRELSSHKGDNGKVLVIAGSRDLAGAALLSSVAALRIGADTVTLACPEKVGAAMNLFCPDIMTIKLKGDHLDLTHYNQIMKNVSNYDSVLIGNGIGMNPKTKSLIKKIIKKIHNQQKVIDADALKMIRLQDIVNSILTPHKKEYQILLKNSRLKIIKQIKNNIILLKGPQDQIISKDKTIINKTGNPGLAKAGTGDVLAGICAGILAKTKDLKRSAEAAAWLNGYIGDILLKKKKGYYFIASDLLDEIKRMTILN